MRAIFATREGAILFTAAFLTLATVALRCSPSFQKTLSAGQDQPEKPTMTPFSDCAMELASSSSTTPTPTTTNTFEAETMKTVFEYKTFAFYAMEDVPPRVGKCKHDESLVQIEYSMQFDPKMVFTVSVSDTPAVRSEYAYGFPWIFDPRDETIRGTRMQFPRLGWWTVSEVRVARVSGQMEGVSAWNATIVLRSDPMVPVDVIHVMGWKEFPSKHPGQTMVNLFHTYFAGRVENPSLRAGEWEAKRDAVHFYPNYGRWMPRTSILFPAYSRKWSEEKQKNEWKMRQIDVSRTAILVTDPWNGAAVRTMARVNFLLEEARRAGMHIILSPGNVAESYSSAEGSIAAYASRYVFFGDDHAQMHSRAQEAVRTAGKILECRRGKLPPSALCDSILTPLVQSTDPVDGGFAKVRQSRWIPEEEWKKTELPESALGKPMCPYESDPTAVHTNDRSFPWFRIHKCIRVASDDYVVDDALTMHALLQQFEIETIIMVGGDLTQCILGRETGVVRLGSTGRRIILLRDLVISGQSNNDEEVDDILRSIERLHGTETMDIRGIGGVPRVVHSNRGSESQPPFFYSFPIVVLLVMLLSFIQKGRYSRL
eukprot:ANDGO_02212.mRNA.1 hypothetical protein